jgi:ABC-2 type transport system permease protein
MSALNSAGRQLKWNQKTYWRNPAAAGFTFAFPLLFLVVFIAINGNDRVDVTGGRVKFAQFYVPAIVAFGLISACYTNLAFSVTLLRERRILKRVRGTPLSPIVYLSGLIGNAVVVSLILSALVIMLGVVVYGITFPDHYLGLAVAVVTGAFCFSALGIAVSTFVPNEDAAPAIINFALFPLLFISGTFGPVSSDSVLSTIATVFPMQHLNKLMQRVFNPFAAGTAIHSTDVALLVLWGLIGVAVSVRRFRWEPNRG